MNLYDYFIRLVDNAGCGLIILIAKLNFASYFSCWKHREVLLVFGIWFFYFDFLAFFSFGRIFSFVFDAALQR